MAWRVTEEEVRELVDSDSTLSVAPFIATANALTDYVSSADDADELTAALLISIEKHLAAHFYTQLDPQEAEAKTADASAKFQGEFGKGLERTPWGQAAMMFDTSGTLVSLSRGRRKVGITWLGKPVSEQIDYEDRD